jgi:hypothetical protein
MHSAASRATFTHAIPQPVMDDWKYGDLPYVLRDARPQPPPPRTTTPGSVTPHAEPNASTPGAVVRGHECAAGGASEHDSGARSAANEDGHPKRAGA